jgi:hypothetical protein
VVVPLRIATEEFKEVCRLPRPKPLAKAGSGGGISRLFRNPHSAFRNRLDPEFVQKGAEVYAKGKLRSVGTEKANTFISLSSARLDGYPQVVREKANSYP